MTDLELILLAEIAAQLCLRYPGQINTDTALGLAAIPEADREQIISRALALQKAQPFLSLDEFIPIVCGASIGELIIEGTQP